MASNAAGRGSWRALSREQTSLPSLLRTTALTAQRGGPVHNLMIGLIAGKATAITERYCTWPDKARARTARPNDAPEGAETSLEQPPDRKQRHVTGK
jgi:hypothetical protein